MFEAREVLILRRETHLDQLADTLREPRVRRVIEPLLSGGDGKYSDRDREYVRDLGLIAPDFPLRLANPIYAEVVGEPVRPGGGLGAHLEPGWTSHRGPATAARRRANGKGARDRRRHHTDDLFRRRRV